LGANLLDKGIDRYIGIGRRCKVHRQGRLPNVPACDERKSIRAENAARCVVRSWSHIDAEEKKSLARGSQAPHSANPIPKYNGRFPIEWRILLEWAPARKDRNGCQVRRREFVTTKQSLVSVVDDDESIRESLPDLLREFGFAARSFSSAEEFLASDCVGQTKCLILDVAMPGMSGPDLQRELARRRQKIPIVFITAHSDPGLRPEVLKEGAVECLFKPFSDTALLAALNAALHRS
jgi:CheY-like chemotaxis protein